MAHSHYRQIIIRGQIRLFIENYHNKLKHLMRITCNQFKISLSLPRRHRRLRKLRIGMMDRLVLGRHCYKIILCLGIKVIIRLIFRMSTTCSKPLINKKVPRHPTQIIVIKIKTTWTVRIGIRCWCQLSVKVLLIGMVLVLVRILVLLM